MLSQLNHPIQRLAAETKLFGQSLLFLAFFDSVLDFLNLFFSELGLSAAVFPHSLSLGDARALSLLDDLTLKLSNSSDDLKL